MTGKWDADDADFQDLCVLSDYTVSVMSKTLFSHVIRVHPCNLRPNESVCLCARFRLLQYPRLQWRRPMKTQAIIFYFIICACIFLSPASDVTAVEPAPKISDREIIESLMRLEAGIQANAVAIKANAQAIKVNAEAIKANGEMIGSLGTEMKSDVASLRDGMKSDVASLRDGMKSDVASLRDEMKSDMTSLRNEMKSDVASLRNEMKSDVASLRNEMKSDMASLRNGMKSDMASLRNEVKSAIESFRTEITGFLLWGFGLLFTGMLILVGFILWDRRSTLKPVKDEIDDLKERKVDRIIAALKKLSEDDARFAQVLRSVGLL